MVINISIQYNGGSSPDITLLIQELFTDWGRRGYDDSVPGEVTKTHSSGDRTT